MTYGRHRWAGKIPLIAESLVLLGIAALAWALSYEFAGRDMLFRWGPEFWPRLAAGLLATLAVAQLVLGFGSGNAGAAPERSIALDMRIVVRLAAMVAVLLGYALLLPRAGFIVATPLFVAGMIFLFGMRKPGRIVIGAAAIHAVFVLVFRVGLGLPLPQGWWPALRSFNIAVETALGL